MKSSELSRSIFATATRERNLIRFRSKYVINKENGCWEWIARLNEHGYGLFVICADGAHLPFLAHRVSYFCAHGELDPDVKVLHRCDNRRCVNPDDLFLGTQLDNIQDMVRKGRNVLPKPHPGSLHPTAKLTEADVEEIRRLYVPRKVTLKALGDRFGVCEASISMIISGKRWAA